MALLNLKGTVTGAIWAAAGHGAGWRVGDRERGCHDCPGVCLPREAHDACAGHAGPQTSGSPHEAGAEPVRCLAAVALLPQVWGFLFRIGYGHVCMSPPPPPSPTAHKCICMHTHPSKRELRLRACLHALVPPDVPALGAAPADPACWGRLVARPVYMGKIVQAHNYNEKLCLMKMRSVPLFGGNGDVGVGSHFDVCVGLCVMLLIQACVNAGMMQATGEPSS